MKHKNETDTFYRMSHGLSSKLLKYQNGIIHLELIINQKWKKNHNAAASEIGQIWKGSYVELADALGCKVFIIDERKGRSLQKQPHPLRKPEYDAYKGILFIRNYLN